jgi:ribosomal protein S14
MARLTMETRTRFNTNRKATTVIEDPKHDYMQRWQIYLCRHGFRLLATNNYLGYNDLFVVSL